MAHSFGGIIASSYVYKYHNFVDKLILLNTTLNMEDSFKSQIHYGAELLSKEELQSTTYNSDLEKWKYIVNMLTEKDIFYKLQYKEYFTNYFDLTKEITVPVLVVTGNEDYAVGPNHYKNFMFPNKKMKLCKANAGSANATPNCPS